MMRILEQEEEEQAGKPESPAEKRKAWSDQAWVMEDARPMKG